MTAEMETAEQEIETPEADEQEAQGNEPETKPKLSYQSDQLAADAEGDEADQEDGDEAPEIEYVKVEWDGQEYEVPAQLKDGFLRQQDYTRKTQEVAEQRRQVEAWQQQMRQEAQVTQDEINAAARLHQIGEQMQAFQNLDWATLENEDPIQAQSLTRQWFQLTNQQQQAINDLQQSREQRNAIQAQNTHNLVAQSRAEASKRIPGWNEQGEKEAFEFVVKKLGVPGQLLAQNLTPAVYEAAYYAHLGWKAANQSVRPKPKTAPPEQATPANKVRGRRSAPPGLHDGLSAEEWVEKRNEQVRRRSG